MYYGYKISDYTANLAKAAEADCQEVFKKIDEVAYVRFASVYRQFKDINTFMSELSKLLQDN